MAEKFLKEVATMKCKIQSVLGHQCPFFHFLSVLFIFRVLYPLASFHPSVHLLPLFFITLEILYPEGRKWGFKLLLKENKVFIRSELCHCAGGKTAVQEGTCGPSRA